MKIEKKIVRRTNVNNPNTHKQTQTHIYRKKYIYDHPTRTKVYTNQSKIECSPILL